MLKINTGSYSITKNNYSSTKPNYNVIKNNPYSFPASNVSFEGLLGKIGGSKLKKALWKFFGYITVEKLEGGVIKKTKFKKGMQVKVFEKFKNPDGSKIKNYYDDKGILSMEYKTLPEKESILTAFRADGVTIRQIDKRYKNGDITSTVYHPDGKTPQLIQELKTSLKKFNPDGSLKSSTEDIHAKSKTL